MPIVAIYRSAGVDRAKYDAVMDELGSRQV